MCEALGVEPTEEDTPIEIEDFLEETQLAFQIYKYLPDRWEGMSATYLGKDLTNLPFLFDTFKVDDRNLRLYIMNTLQHIDLYVGNDIRRKQKEQARKHGGKTN